MNSEFPFLKNLRRALKVNPGASRTKSTFPELFTTTDTEDLLSTIRSRSYAEKELLIEQLADNCAGLNITLHVVDSLKEAEDVVVELIRTKRPEFSHNRHIIQHTHPDIAAMKLWQRFNRESVTVHTAYPGDEEVKEKTIASYIGITAPDISVADSATLMQLTGPGCPRSTSLVPSIHIAVTRSENLVANLEEGYALLKELDPRESFVFISGPSKTADIEAHLVHGAHGPKELHLIILKEDEPPIEAQPEAEAIAEDVEENTEEMVEEIGTEENQTDDAAEMVVDETPVESDKQQ
ncbi:LutC/YkgG family protein [Desulforhopalus sp. 52FAK]